nr:hypothetical protein CFP56_71657 [Quercus suber]POE99141.1 hypothetical protein CFP56_76360 [Quercus suber]
MDMLWYGAIEAAGDNEQIEKLIIVAWALWTNRNEIRTGGVKKSSQKLVTGALHYLAEYQECVREPEKPRSVLPAHLKLLPSNKFKINVDGAMFASQQATGMGVLVRDATGNTIGSFSDSLIMFNALKEHSPPPSSVAAIVYNSLSTT